MDRREQIIKSLDILRRRDAAQPGGIFKARAYAKAISTLEKLRIPVRTLDDVRGLDGVGAKILLKIGEILETGVLAAAENVKSRGDLTIYEELLACYGIGPAKARELVNSGVKSIAHLRELVTADPSMLNDKQKIGLEYYDNLIKRIPRAEMLEHQTLLFSYLDKAIPESRPHAEIVGSFRRGAETSGDIDMLVCGENPVILERFVRELRESGYIRAILAQGDKKCLAISALPGMPARRLDILLTPATEYSYAILYFTGSDKFNVAFRQAALDRGYTLNEHGMKPLLTSSVPSVPCEMKTERNIFHFLRILYVAPEKRRSGEQVISYTIRESVE